jgi:hypothetical protein
MLRRSLSALAPAILAISVSLTKSDAQVVIEGQLDCGMWVEARTEGRAPYLEHYLVGLLNGMAYGTNIEFWYAGGVLVSQEQVFLWMDNYCRREPLSHVITGATVLMNERTGNAWASFHARH